MYSGSYKNRFGSTNMKVSTIKALLIAMMCIVAIKNVNFGYVEIQDCCMLSVFKRIAKCVFTHT